MTLMAGHHLSGNLDFRTAFGTSTFHDPHHTPANHKYKRTRRLSEESPSSLHVFKFSRFQLQLTTPRPTVCEADIPLGSSDVSSIPAPSPDRFCPRPSPPSPGAPSLNPRYSSYSAYPITT